MTEPLKVGVIGVGYLGHFHAEKYAALKETQLVGVADVNLETAETVAQALGTKAFSHYQMLLPLVEAVSVAVPTTGHHEVVKAALTQGCHVLVEKPLAVTVAEADELVRLSRQRERTLMVGHLERFNPAMEELIRHARQPRFIESHRLGVFKGRGTDVDVVLDLMIHDLDLVLSVVQTEVREIRAAGVSVLTDNVDLANVRLEFEGGCIANLTASRMSFKSMRKFRLFQPDAYLAVDFEARELTHAERREGAVGLIPGVALDVKRFPQEDVLLREIKSFIGSVQNHAEPVVSGEAGRAALALEINAAMQKARV